MGLFNFFRKKNQFENQEEINDDVQVDKNLFVEDSDPVINSNPKIGLANSTGLDAIYAFLQRDFESIGYQDSLIIPDEIQMTKRIKEISLDFNILIKQSTTYYKDIARELDFNIKSRSRMGFLDLVEELKYKKEMIDDHLKTVEEIKSDVIQDKGIPERIFLSYNRGFLRGITAITQANILSKK